MFNAASRLRFQVFDDLRLTYARDAAAGRQIVPQAVALPVDRRIDLVDGNPDPARDVAFLVEVTVPSQTGILPAVKGVLQRCR